MERNYLFEILSYNNVFKADVAVKPRHRLRLCYVDCSARAAKEK